MSWEFLPEKSKALYLSSYKIFIDWQNDQGIVEINEVVILGFLTDMAKKLAPNSVMARYAMLKKCLINNHQIDIFKYSQVQDFLKRNNDGYIPKTSLTFTGEEIGRFITEAPDYNYLGLKAVAIIGISGMLNREEIYYMKASHLSFEGESLFVKIPKAKNKIPHKLAIT